jgi:spore protease
MSDFEVRTDLALETREKMKEEQASLHGVKIEEYEIEESQIKVTKVTIETENAARMMGKPKGTYLTLEAPDMAEHDEDYHREVSQELANVLLTMLPFSGKELKQLLKSNKPLPSVLVVGLGNRQVTPDALGPRVVDNLFVTRHIIREYGKYVFGEEGMIQISGIVPGVMAQTGMETLEIVKGIIKETKPQVVIAIDALAARSTKRLSRTIQISDTGIHPGSGVGNHRCALNESSVGVPVIAIGVPTVVDAATIVSDTIKSLVDEIGKETNAAPLSDSVIREMLSPGLNTMFVTPKDIDETVKNLSYTISEGLNLAFSSV